MVKLVINLEKSRAQFQTLDKECKVFATYLVGQEPTDYVLGKYREAHKYTRLLDDSYASGFDKFLLNISVQHPIFVHLVDSYTSLLHKKALFRSKLVLLVAIMESTAPTYANFEKTDSPNIIGLGFKMSISMLWFAISLFLAVILFSPIRLGYSLISRPTSEGSLL